MQSTFPNPARVLRVAALVLGWSVCGAHAGEPLEPAAAPPTRHTPISEVLFAAFDTETTGFSLDQDRIVEIGVVKFRGGEVLERKGWLVNPGRPIPYWAERVHHINDDMVADEPPYEAIYPEFVEFVGDAVLLAHNARFDIAFIGAEARRRGLTLPENKVLDTLTLFKAWFPEAESHSLEGLAQFLSADTGGFHRAEGDSMVLFTLLQMGLSRHPHIADLGHLEKAAGGAKGF